MISFDSIDIVIVLLYFLIIISIGIFASRKSNGSSESYLLSGRSVGLFLFVLTNVATWYGGILGVGEFTYRYGLLSWFTQGFPYYIFAILFALFFAKKIRTASLFTIPDKIEETYDRTASLISAFLIFILVSPAPYLFMIGSLISIVFGIDLLPSLLIGVLVSSVYLFKGGYKANIFTDAFSFFTMFLGFIIAVVISVSNYGGLEYLDSNLPETHLQFTGGAPPAFIFVWFLIALWTFTDPGFHQRCYSAKTGSIAVKGIIISVAFWALFDFLTTTLGLFSRAILGEIDNPVLAFPLLAEKIMGPGVKGIFYAALFATILSTLNSFLFLSATTFGRDFAQKLKPGSSESELNKFTKVGLIVSAVISVLLAYYFESVVQIWYTIGSICIPGIILLIFGAYYPKLKVTNKIANIEIVGATGTSLIWFFIREGLEEGNSFSVIEPMIVGVAAAVIIHTVGLLFARK
ncbi:MAG: sodium:solute symporter family protein [Ignavibacteriae bacterium]|nr:sodium:solute symporter family protein [Ignavibacteriota bacterium]NOG98300.1 sodium:solute symporter family protein [Ignavibacteriota bacterium]